MVHVLISYVFDMLRISYVTKLQVIKFPYQSENTSVTCDVSQEGDTFANLLTPCVSIGYTIFL